MNDKPKKVILSHIHSRIDNLSKQALEKGLIVGCDKTENDTYLITKPGELPIEYKPISAGVILLTLLN